MREEGKPGTPRQSIHLIKSTVLRKHLPKWSVSPDHYSTQVATTYLQVHS
jgi:hypothetical protein